MSQITQPKSELRGLHDPHADIPAGLAVQPRPTTPLMTMEIAGELRRAAATLAALFAIVAIAITLLHSGPA